MTSDEDSAWFFLELKRNPLLEPSVDDDPNKYLQTITFSYTAATNDKH